MHVKVMVLVLCIVGSCLIFSSTATGGEIHNAVKAGNLEDVQAILDRHTEVVNVQDEKGKTPLHYAITLNRNSIAEYLIIHEADINLTDNNSESPLHHAAAVGNSEIATLLLQSGTTSLDDASSVKHGGFVGKWTPLHVACLNGHPELVHLLLDYGADIEARDGIERTPLILSVESKNLRVAETLVERGADINAQAIRGYTALLLAARNDFEDMVDYLIDRGADIHTDMLPLAFQMAVTGGMSGLYEYVLEQGFNIAEMKERDPGLIFSASVGGSTEIVESLVRYGFQLAQADSDGWTSLHYAASEGHVGMIEYLIAKGVNRNARTKKGETAYNLATAKGYRESADYLKTNGADTSEPQFPILEGTYMGQEPPGDTPEIFMPGIVSGHYRAHSSITFSPDGKEAFWTEMSPGEGAVKVSRMVGNRWSYPITASVDRDPSFSPDGSRLYFIKTRPFKEGEEPGGDPDVKEEYWYMERTDSGWSEPISVGESVNEIGVHWPCSVDKYGNLYFSEFSEKMYCARYVAGEYLKPIILTELFNSPTLVGCCPFISPEGDYLLFVANDSLSISFKKKGGSWTDRINLGAEINASHVNGSPRVTPDGKNMFFVSAGRGRPWGIYWVSADFIERLRAERAAGE